jgi:hypothetical protein
MAEFTSIKERKQWEGLLKIFGDTENGRSMAKMVFRAQNGQITEEDRHAYAQKMADDLALIRTELEVGCVPAIDHIITPEENERLKRELIEKENPQLRELVEEAEDAGIPMTKHLADEIESLGNC